MAATDYDVVIAGTKAKVLEYRKRTIRREIENNLLSQAAEPLLASRSDHRQLYQTSWADGSQWWQPLIGAGNLNSYFQANHMDVWSEPGKVVPMNKVADAANTGLHDSCVIGVGAQGEVYAIGDTAVDDATQRDVFKWTPASDAFIQESGYSSGVGNAVGPMAMVFDPSDGYFYVIADDNHFERFSPGGATEDAGWITTGFTSYLGANVFLQNQNLMFYSGDQIYSVTKGTPAVTSVFNDGMGPDFLNDISFAGTNPLFRENLHLAISTPEGIYYVKNTRQGGQPVAWVFRVDRDAAGNWIGNPIASLPVGAVALSIAHHLGQVIISASPDWQTVVDNDTNEAEIVLYFVGEGGMGALGSILGNRDQVDETPYALLGSSGALLYIGGHKRLWVYDGIRGGLHTVWDWTTELAHGPYVAMAWVQDSAGDSSMIFLGRDRIARTKTSQTNDPDTVAAFGDDEAHYILDSNFFDGGLPMEIKELTKVAILRDAASGANQEWTVQISADEGAYADALVHSTTGEVFSEADLTGTTGYQFRYRLIYQTKDTVRNALKALLVTFTTGEMIDEWDLVLDGDELIGPDNEVQDEEAFYDALVTISATKTLTTFSDNMQEQAQETDTATTVNVKVMAVEIAKDKAGESQVRVVLRDA